MSDDLAPARGCITAAILSLALWAGIVGGALIFWGCWQVIP